MSAYERARTQATQLEAAFYAALEAADRYAVLMATLTAEEEAKAAPSTELVRRFAHQRRETQELVAALEGAALETLLRILDRVLMIKHTEDGTFV